MPEELIEFKQKNLPPPQEIIENFEQEESKQSRDVQLIEHL